MLALLVEYIFLTTFFGLYNYLFSLKNSPPCRDLNLRPVPSRYATNWAFGFFQGLSPFYLVFPQVI